MVWVGFLYRGRTDLVLVDGQLNALSYQDQLLDVAYHRLLADFGSPATITLQDDLSPTHNAKSTHAVQQDLGLKVPLWVGQSPDDNPIDSAWAQL